MLPNNMQVIFQLQIALFWLLLGKIRNDFNKRLYSDLMLLWNFFRLMKKYLKV